MKNEKILFFILSLKHYEMQSALSDQGFLELNFSKSFSLPKNETNDNPKIEK